VRSDFTLFVRKKKLTICVQSRSIASAAALSALGLVDSAAANDKKVVSATLLSFQFPYVVAVSEAMKAEAAKELRMLNDRRSRVILPGSISKNRGHH
jgi:hypothetical protein